MKITHEERDRWNAAAHQEGMNLAELIRELMRARIERQRNDLLVMQAIQMRKLELDLAPAQWQPVDPAKVEG